MLEKVIIHPSSIKELGRQTRKIIDAYWANQISEKECKQILIEIARTEAEKMLRGPKFNPTFQIVVGKKRLSVIEKMLEGYQTKL